MNASFLKYNGFYLPSQLQIEYAKLVQANQAQIVQ